MIRRVVVVALWVLPLAGLLLALALLGRPYQGFAAEAVVVEIPDGVSGSGAGEILARAGVIRSAWTFRWLVRLDGSAPRLRSGEYRFSGPRTLFAVRDTLLRGEVVRHRLTVPEGLTVTEVAALLEGEGWADAGSVRAAARRTEAIADLDPAASDLEGYLFPDTYEFARRTPVDQIVARMVGRFREVFTAARVGAARASGLSPREAVTLASLIEEETHIPSERALVGSVFRNRLRRGMLLQCDPTVAFALALNGRSRSPLTRADLRFESPYNTYLHAGLPPGPIASPGEAALRAAIEPYASDYLYFVASGTGGHHFTRTLPEHLRAVRRYRETTRNAR